MCRLAKESGIRPPILLRLSSGNQFGMDRAAVLNILKNSAHLPICVEGIQYYSGTQKRMGNIFGELDMLVSFFAEAAEIAPQIRRLEYGPGLKVGYFEGDREDKDECLCAAEISDAFDISLSPSDIVPANFHSAALWAMIEKKRG